MYLQMQSETHLTVYMNPLPLRISQNMSRQGPPLRAVPFVYIKVLHKWTFHLIKPGVC